MREQGTGDGENGGRGERGTGRTGDGENGGWGERGMVGIGPGVGGLSVTGRVRSVQGTGPGAWLEWIPGVRGCSVCARVSRV